MPFYPSVRRSVAGTLQTLFQWKVAPVFGLYYAWVFLLVSLALQVGIWTPSLTKDTFLWALTAGSALVLNFSEAAKLGFVRRRIVESVGFAAALEYLVGLSSFSFWIEFALPPIVLVAAVAPALQRGKPDGEKWAVWGPNILALTTAVLLFHTSLDLFATAGTMDMADRGREALWPIVLAIGSLPFVFGLALVASYETAFLKLGWAQQRKGASTKSRLGLALGLGLRLRLVHEAGKGGTFKIATAATLRDARIQAKVWAAQVHEKDRTVAQAQEDLKTYAGSTGVDADGKRLDKREFKETRDALDFLALCMHGWYSRDPAGFYKDRLAAPGLGFTGKGLPEAHGISMRISADGQSWYASRRTVSGWCFGIGMAGAQYRVWHYDGPNTPQDFPGQTPDWGKSSFDLEQSPNWWA